MNSSIATTPVALVTGAAHRIGAEICRTLHAAGYNIVIHYRHSEAGARELKKELDAQRPNSSLTVGCDILHHDAHLRLIDAAISTWGRLDVLVNNASTFYPTPAGKITQNDWDDLLGTNLHAPLFLSQTAIPALRETQGSIVNIVDIHADRPLRNHPVYSVAKAGLVMLTKTLARELGPDIRVNAVAPGAILWPESGVDEARKEDIISRTVLKRQGTPHDIAKAVLFLARDANYTSGHVLNVDGGRSLTT